MARRVNDLSFRTVLICFPDAGVEYRFTDQTFAAGDKLRHNGNTWVVTEVEDRPTGPIVRLGDAEVVSTVPPPAG